CSLQEPLCLCRLSRRFSLFLPVYCLFTGAWNPSEKTNSAGNFGHYPACPVSGSFLGLVCSGRLSAACLKKVVLHSTNQIETGLYQFGKVLPKFPFMGCVLWGAPFFIESEQPFRWGKSSRYKSLPESSSCPPHT